MNSVLVNMKALALIFVTLLVSRGTGFLIKVPDIQEPTIRTSSLGWIHVQKLLLPLFDNVCEESTDPIIVRLAKEFTTDSITDSYVNAEVVLNLKKLYSANGQLKKGVIFTELNQDHMYEFQLLCDVLYNAQTFDAFYKTAAWARQNVNCGLFVNAIYLAILKRRDTERITVPAPYELLPHYFIRRDTIIKASSLLAGGDIAATEGIVNEGNTYILNANYTSNVDSNDESKLAYFHEDVGLNTYYFLKRLQWSHIEDVTSNHAEFMYHFMKQLSARYNLERYSNGLTLLDRFDWATCNNIGSYDPMLVFSNGQEFTPRHSGIDLTNKRFNNLINIEDNLVQMMPTLAQNGYTKAQIISNLMNILVLNLENYESDVRNFFGDDAAENRSLSVLGHYMTSLRDPLFWKINQKMVNIVDDALKTVPGYSRNDLYFPGVQVVNVEVKKISTMFEPFKLEVTDALKTSTDHPMFDVNVRESRLNHKPFTLKLNISSLVSQKGLVKIYLGPKILPGEFAMKKDLFMLLDNFECNLKIGSNIISRSSNAIEGVSEDFVSFKMLRKLVEDAEFGLEVEPLNALDKLSGFPSRLILPKGTPEGLSMQLLVFVAPFIKVTAGGISVIPKTEFNSATLSPGYPFDLDFDDAQFFALPNLRVKDIVITHKDSSGGTKGKFDGSKKWSGNDSTNSYGPTREPYNYNLKKTQYGKTEDFMMKTDDQTATTMKVNDDEVTKNVPEVNDYQIDGEKMQKSDIDADEESVSYKPEDKIPYALKLINSPYGAYDTEARREKYNDEAKRHKYDYEAKINKYYNKNLNRNRNQKQENDKLGDKIKLNKDVSDIIIPNTKNFDGDDSNVDVLQSINGLEPKYLRTNNIEEMFERVVPIRETVSNYDFKAPIVKYDDYYIYE